MRKCILLGIQLARALAYAHRRGIVHRDIKPANILLLQDDDTAKIADFGIAHLDNAPDMQRTEVGTVLGTPRYMAPEQIGGQPVDGRSDLFSLGAILYELLTGRRAFEHENLASLLVQILQKNPPPPSRFAPEIPEGLDRAVMKLLSKRPEQRFQTGAQVAEALERELQAALDAERARSQNRFLPLRVKLALRASCALALVFAACLSVIYYAERNVLRAQAVDSGAALAKFVAVEAAVPVLGQNWLPLKLFVQDAKARGSFDYLAVVDHRGIVEAATESKLVGRPYVAPQRQALLSSGGGAAVEAAKLDDGRAAFLFDTPILFQNTRIGRIYLGVDEAATDQVLRGTLTLFAGLGLLCIGAVGSLSYLFGGMLAKPMRLLRDALVAIAEGDWDRRISQTRPDEIGELFTAFNSMAENIQQSLCVPPALDGGQPAKLMALNESHSQTETLLVPA